MFDYVKRLGQWHKAENNASVTVCEMPMLGTNYRNVISVTEREPCPDCMDMLGFTHSIDEINEMFELN